MPVERKTSGQEGGWDGDGEGWKVMVEVGGYEGGHSGLHM